MDLYGPKTQDSVSPGAVRSKRHHYDFDISLLTDFDTAFSQFSSDFALTTMGETAEFQEPSTSQQHLAKSRALTPLLNEKESNAFSDFLDRVMVDPNFLLDPKVVDELPHWTEPVDSPISNIAPPPDNSRPVHLMTQVPDHRPLHTMPDLAFPLNPHGLHELDNLRDPSNEAHESINGVLESMPNNIQNIDDSMAQNRSPSASSDVADSKKDKSRKRLSLTEDQKRLNHISSEKRRRALIKQHFEEICSLVPQLDASSASGRSKSETLNTIYDYLVLLVEQNKTLRNFLHANGISELSF